MNGLARVLITSVSLATILSAPAAAAPPVTTTQATQPTATAPAATQPTTQPTTAPGEEPCGLSFKDTNIETIAKFLSEKLGKSVIPLEAIKSKKITIVSTKKMPLDEALQILHEALREAGVMVVEGPNTIKLKPVSDAKHSQLAVIGPEQSVSEIADKTKIVDKVFVIKYYDTLTIKDMIVPMLPEYGHVIADPNTRKLVVTDAVGNLERIEKVIASLDVPMAEQTLKRIIQIQRGGDASEIISILRPLIEATLGKAAKDVSTGGGGASPGRGSSPSMGSVRSGGSMPPGGSGPSRPSGAKGGATTVVVIKASKTPVVLVTDVSRNRIIAVAPAEIMKLIEEWVAILDEPSKAENDFEVFQVKFADMDEVAQQIQRTVESMPNEELRKSIRVVPFIQSRKLLVFGSQRGREIVRTVLKDLDVESSEYQVTKEFPLKNADAETVAKKLEQLFSRRQLSYESSYGYRSYRHESGGARMQVVPDTRLQTVTVVTDANTMKRVEEMIAEWDKPLSPDEVEPRIYTLKYADPVQIKDLLDEMFARRRQRASFFEMLFGSSRPETPPVGRLFGQFSFQAMADSNKLIAITKNPANYAVIDRLIEKLDQPQEAGLPLVVELKHAYAEDLCERLNALLSEPGTLASILRSEGGLSRRERRGGIYGAEDASARQPARSDPQAANAQVMTFWWQRGRTRSDEQPASNLIGKIRFVPYGRRNALMVVAPPGYIEPIKELVEDLDRPGIQVMIHAIIAEIQHDDMTTIGVRFASDPSLLANPRLYDTSIGGGATVNANELLGGTFAIGSTSFGRVVLAGDLNVSFLIQMLIKRFNMKVLFEPKLTTADNQQAEFFDGSDVPVITQARTSAEGTTTVSNIIYQEVGTLLRIRPHITQEGDVDLTINLELSRQVPGETILGSPVFDRRETTTNVIVRDGQTMMLSGITRQEEFEEVRKLPLLGDIPLIGLLFRSVDKGKANRELVAFITPTVIRTSGELDEKMKKARRGLERLKREMGVGTETTDDPAPTTQEAAP